MERPIARVVDLVDPDSQNILNMTVEQAQHLLLDSPEEMTAVHGSFALIARRDETVRLARSLDRPLRYFLAKEADGPMLVVSERIDSIHGCLEEFGYGAQFHPTYTRMVPAHYVTTLALVGCPDPNPTHVRFFDPPRAVLPLDLDLIGRRYAEALRCEVRSWLEAQAEAEPIGVLFSGGVDSGAVLLTVYRTLLDLGQSPARLKAFTLRVGTQGSEAAGNDGDQAREFLRATGLELLGEEIVASPSALDPYEAVEVIEDYKPLDVECATVGLALLEGIRQRYPSWRLLVDGDGGDENLKDYPIEENEELTIRSVVSNRMLYQEGWGVDAIKHSLTYSGGLSRGCVRTFAPARRFGFSTFSPFTRPSVVAVAEAIPFDRLTEGSNEALYGLKGEIVRRGLRQVLELDLPVFPKCRFQQGATTKDVFDDVFDVDPDVYRRHFLKLHTPA